MLLDGYLRHFPLNFGIILPKQAFVMCLDDYTYIMSRIVFIILKHICMPARVIVAGLELDEPLEEGRVLSVMAYTFTHSRRKGLELHGLGLHPLLHMPDLSIPL